MIPESDLLPLAGLQHLAFCERQWALIQLEQFWAENRLTAEGRRLHERADSQTRESRRDVRIVRGLMIQSLELGVVGRADVVEFHRVPGTDVSGDAVAVRKKREDRMRDSPAGESEDASPVEGVRLSKAAGYWRPFPVEYKRGRPKPFHADRVQLCAQALCLEEMLAVAVPAGALFYGKTRRRFDVAIDDALRSETVRLARRMHELFRLGVTPRVSYDRRRCDRCSLFDRCLPKTTGAAPSVAAYVAAAWREARNDP